MIFLLPFLVHHAVTEKNNLQLQQQTVEIQRKQYELALAEHNAHYGANTTVNKGVLVYKGNKKPTK